MQLCRQGSQLSRAPRDRRRPPTRSLAACLHPRDQPTQKRHRSPLSPGSCRLLPSVCQEFCSHRRPTACLDPERRSLPLELRVPGRLRPPQNAPHHQPHHCLSRLQLTFPSIYGRVDCRPRSNPCSNPGWQGAHHLLRVSLPQPSRKSLPRHQVGMPRHCLGRCEVPTIPHVHAIRGLHGPLRLAMAQNNEDGVLTPAPLVSRSGGVRFTVKYRPGKSQTHVDGFSRLPVDPPPPEDNVLQVRLLEDEEEARKIARELHAATNLGGHAWWKLFCDRYSHKAGRCICLETAQSCPQCQLGTDYGHRQKTTGTIQSQSPWDMLSIDIVGPLPPDHHQEFLIVFMDCYSKYTILIPSSNHTANMVREALMCYVIPYFGTPRQLLSDRGREFISDIWTKLLCSLGIQQDLTSPYHLEGNAINERSHQTFNNMLCARLLKGPSSKA